MNANIRKSVVMFTMAAAGFSANAQNLESGIKMFNYHRWQSAQKILQPLAATDIRANYYLGLTYLELNDAANATACFTKFPEDPANISGTAMVAFNQKDTAKAMHILRDLAAKAKKKEFEPLRFAGEAIIRTQGGDVMQAIQWDSMAVKRGAKDAALFISLGDAFRRVPGGGGSAMDNYEHARDAETCNSLAYSRIGDLWFDATNYKLALENYSKAKECDATNPLPYKALAEAFQRSGRYDKALENMQQYMKLSDNSFNDKKMNVEILYQSKNYCDAITQSRELMNTNPIADSVKMELYGIIGFSQPYCNDSLGAVDNIRKYFAMQKPSKIRSAAYIDFGKLWLRLNELDSAAYYYGLGLKADTTADKTEIYRQLAEAFKTKKNYTKSAEWYNNLIQANPETQAADYAWRSIMYYYCGDYANGLATSQVFMKKYPEQPSAYLYAAKSAANIDSTDTSGLAVPFYDQWLEKVGPNYDKKNELKSAYGYELTFYFNKEDKDKMNVVKEKLRALDPNDKYLKQIEDLEKEAQKQKARAAQKPQPKK